MPFVESVEEADVLALASLYQLALLKWDRLTTSTRFDEFTSHPTVTDGITDEETVFITLCQPRIRNKSRPDRYTTRPV